MLTRLSPLAGYGLQSGPRADAANTSGIRNWATFGSRRAIGLCPRWGLEAAQAVQDLALRAPDLTVPGPTGDAPRADLPQSPRHLTDDGSSRSGRMRS